MCSGDVFREDGILSCDDTNARVNAASSAALFARTVTSKGCIFEKCRAFSNGNDRAFGIQRHRRGGTRSRARRRGITGRQHKDCTAVDGRILRHNGVLGDFQVGRALRYGRDVVYSDDGERAPTSATNSRAYRFVASASSVPGKYRGGDSSLTR